MAGNSFQAPSRKSSHSRLSATLETVRLAVQSNSSGNIDKSLVVDLVSQLEFEDYSVCSRLEPKLCCTIIQTLLQCHNCRDSERGIYIFGAALYYDGVSPSKEHNVKKKKEVIGKECLGLLLDFFADGSKSSSMRQWVGILALQLFENCDSNVQKFELGPEQQRRELGNVVLKEPNEIIRIICGQLITSLLSAGVISEHIWPVNIDKRLYENFPTASLGSRGWNQQFQKYMDNVFEITEPADSVGQLYFTQNVSLTPQHNFGPEDHNVAVVVEPRKMSIWAGVVVDTENFNHCLEVPLEAIKKMIIQARSNSQLSGVLNVHLFLDERDQVCYLDCTYTALTQVCMVLQQSVVEAMRDELHIFCPHLEVIDEDRDKPGVVTYQDGPENSQHISQSIEIVQCSSNGTSTVRTHVMPSMNTRSYEAEPEMIDEEIAVGITKAPIASGVGSTTRSTREQIALNGVRGGVSVGDASGSSPEIEMVKEPTKTERKRAQVPKPKAKPPLRQVTKSGIRQELHSSSAALMPEEPMAKGLSYVLKVNGELNRSTQLFEESNMANSRSRQGKKKRERRSTLTAAAPDYQRLNSGVLPIDVIESKKYPLERTFYGLDDDVSCYDIPLEECHDKQLTATENHLDAGVKSAQPIQTTRQTMGKKAGVKNIRSTKVNQKKRQSTPATLELANARERVQRRAAAVANKKLTEAYSSDDENLVNSGLESQISKPKKKSTSSANAESTQQPKPKIAVSSIPENDKEQREDQEEDACSIMIEDEFTTKPSGDLYRAMPVIPAASPAHLVNTSGQPFDDLYDATPTKPAMRSVRNDVAARDEGPYPSLPNQEFQILGKMAANMSSLLENLDEPNGSEGILLKKLDLEAKQGLRKLSTESPEKVLANDYLCRKTPVVGFNDKGARNQGPPGMLTGSNGQSNIGGLAHSRPTRTEQVEDRKRKRENTSNVENSSPPRKRQSLSPKPHHNPVQSTSDSISGSIFGNVFGSSPLSPYQIKSHRQSSGIRRNGSLPRLQRVSKPSSQVHHVDKNGSPLAARSSQIDRIGNVKRKLLDDDDDASEAHTPKSTHPRPLFAKRSPEIFGPKVRLGSIPKARPSSSLEEAGPRYIPHKKTRNGQYEGLNTNEIIAPERALVDPFTDKVARPISRFSGRLLSGTSSAIAGSKELRRDMACYGLDRDVKKPKDMPADANKTEGTKSKTYGRVSRRLTDVFLDEDEETLVEPVNRSPSDRYSIPDMTSDTTYESRSPLVDKRAWNVAVRPHYTNLSETIHQIADEVIIRLSNEEDTMKLITDQYKENGEKILHQAAQKRSEEKAIMATGLDQRMEEMVAVYTEAKGLADRTKQAMKNTPLSGVDKQWRTTCETVQAQIDKGKMASEGQK